MKDTETATLQSVTFDPDSLTFGELVDIEKETGEPWAVFVARFADASRGKGIVTAQDMMLATWLVMRRVDPGTSLDDIRDMRFTAVWGE